MDAVDASSGVFVIAQGLLMYLETAPVRQLFIGMADRFPDMEIVFDTVPRWFSQLTVQGLNQTSSYRLPPMPWGINRDEVEPTLRGWHPGVASVQMLRHRIPRGLPRLLGDIVTHIPLARHAVPSLVHVKVARAVGKDTGRYADLENECLLLNEPPRIPDMSDNSSAISNANTMENVLSVATQNAMRSADIVTATGQVIAKRVALGMAAAFDPMHADHAEFARMVPEKVKAFSTSGMVMLQQTREATRQMMQLASDEAATARAAIEMADYSSPAALAAAQGRLARAYFGRAATSLFKMGMLALSVQAAAMAPIHATVVGNAERLGR
jgi:hypothetical protein